MRITYAAVVVQLDAPVDAMKEHTSEQRRTDVIARSNALGGVRRSKCFWPVFYKLAAYYEDGAHTAGRILRSSYQSQLVASTLCILKLDRC